MAEPTSIEHLQGESPLNIGSTVTAAACSLLIASTTGAFAYTGDQFAQNANAIATACPFLIAGTTGALAYSGGQFARDAKVTAAACSFLIASTTGAFAYTGEQFARDANISLEQARAIATKARRGRITDQELEKEVGGSGLRFSFNVENNGKTYEVGIDAKTGKILENKTERPNPA